jgi:hypothetical protein
MLAIARHRAISALRRRSSDQIDDEMLADIPDSADNAEAILQKQDKVAVLQQCLARISHANQRIGAPNQRELLCRNDFRRFEGEPRCRQSVARKYLILEPWKVALWKLHLTLDWSRRTRERCFWERPIGRLI